MGGVPNWLQNRLGIVACRDGSTGNNHYEGAEWVTVPMSGAKGLQTLVTLGRELSKRCAIDISCSLHFHIGNIPTERVYLVSLYMLVYQIQEDMLKMFPYYKTDHRDIKRKNYCQKLEKMSIYSLKDYSKEGYEAYIEHIYLKLFQWLSDGHAADSEVNRRRERHPIDAKWNRPSRYFIVNLQHMLFSPRRTCEHRLHSGSQNPQKICFWLFMCNAINKYAQENMKSIISGEKITFIDVLNYYSDKWKGDANAKFLSDLLCDYYTKRCKDFAKDKEKGDKVSEWDLKQDSSYKFTYQGVSLFS